MVQHSTLHQRQSQLGFLPALFAGVAGAASIGLQSYATITTLDLAKDQADLQEDLARQRADLEARLFDAQSRIMDIQASGMSERQIIELDVAHQQAESIERQLARTNELEDLRHSIEMAQLQRDATAEASGMVTSEVSSMAPVETKTSNAGMAIVAMVSLGGLAVWWGARK